MWVKKSLIICSRHFWRKFLFYKKLSNFAQTLTHFYQIPYQKNFKIWANLNNFLLNKIFVPILTVFLWIRPYFSCFVPKHDFIVRKWEFLEIVFKWFYDFIIILYMQIRTKSTGLIYKSINTLNFRQLILFKRNLFVSWFCLNENMSFGPWKLIFLKV